MPDHARPTVIVSNRGPLSFALTDEGTPLARRGAGGLVSGLLPLVAGTDTLWIAAALSDADRLAAADGALEADGVHIRLVDVPTEILRPAYDVIGNATLWFVHHGLFDLARRPRFDDAWHRSWAAFRDYNRLMAGAVADSAPHDAVVLVQDYHLSLLAPVLTAARPDLTLVHFSHTPFGGPDLLHTLPAAVRLELLDGLRANAACGFHTARWERGFLASCDDAGVLPPSTFVAPLGPDPDDLADSAAGASCRDAAQRLDDAIGDRATIVRVDRIELSKNIVRGFLAFDDLLERHPEHRGNVVFAASIYPSRQGHPDYLAYRQEVEAVVDRINRRWGTAAWHPILLDTSDDYPASIAALQRYDVLLVNALRDGLNLVAKEGPLVNRRDGVVVLSTEAGSHDELASAVVPVDPYDITGTADALHRALELDPAERASRASALRRLVSARTPRDWLADQIGAARAE